MTLDDAERARFAAYLRQDAQANRDIAGRLGPVMGPAIAALYRQKLADAEAEERVAGMLESAETFAIGPKAGE